MYKKSLLSYAATAAIILFNIPFNVHAESLTAGKGQTVAGGAGKTYNTLHAKEGGKITGEKLTVSGNKNTNTGNGSYVVITEGTIEGAKSTIELKGLTIKGTDTSVRFGLSAKDGAQLTVDGGTITVSDTGAFFSGSAEGSQLKGVTISSGKDDAPLNIGVKVDTKGIVALEDVNVSQANSAVTADGESKITISKGSFSSKEATISAQTGSAITLTGVTQVTSSNGNGLFANGLGSSITMAKGEVEGDATITGHTEALAAKDGGHISVADATLKTTNNKNGTAASANGSTDKTKSMIDLSGKTTISDSVIGLSAENGGVIKMAGGSITASQTGMVSKGPNSTIELENEAEITGGTIGLSAQESGHITANKDVTLKTNNKDGMAAIASGSTDKTQSMIKLSGNTTISDSAIGLGAQGGGSIDMAGGTITTSQTGATSNGSKSEIKLSGNTTINSDVTGLNAENGGSITMAGGSITASQTGMVSKGPNSTIELENKTEVTGGKIGLSAQKSGHIKAKDVTLKTNNKNGQAAIANGSTDKTQSMIDLSGNTTISDSAIGLIAQGGGSITMAGGSITTSQTGAISNGSNSTIKLLEETAITSGTIGLGAQGGGSIQMAGGSIAASQTGAISNGSNSTIKLLGETAITGSVTGLDADNGGSITMAGGAITASKTGVISHGSNSRIELLGKTTINGSGTGLSAENGGSIKMTGGAINASKTGVVSHGPNSKIELEDKTEVTGGTVALNAQEGGYITGNDVTLKTNNNTGIAAIASGSTDKTQSMIKLSGNTTISDSAIGLGAQGGGSIDMAGGTITTSQTGATSNGSNSEIKLSGNTTINGGVTGLNAENGGSITMAEGAITASKTGVISHGSNSRIELLGKTTINGSGTGLSAQNGGSIKMTGGAINASKTGVVSHGPNSKIELEDKTKVTGGTVALNAQEGGHITGNDVTLKTNNNTGIAAIASGSTDKTQSMIDLSGNTTISDSAIGLIAQKGGSIDMAGGTITTSQTGAVSNGSNSEIKLSGNTTINSGVTGLSAQENGSIEANKDVTLKTNNENGIAAIANGSTDKTKSMIKLSGNTTISDSATGLSAQNGGLIQMAGGSITTSQTGAISHGPNSKIDLSGKTAINGGVTGLSAQEGGSITMAGGSITASQTGAIFNNSENNELKDVTISSGNDDTPLNIAIDARKSTVALENVNVLQANHAVAADDHSTITISKGSFAAKNTTISAQNGSTITLTDVAQVTSSEGNGLLANGQNSSISMKNGNIKGKYTTLAALNGGHITVNGVAITAGNSVGVGAQSTNSDSAIELHGSTIDNTFIGLFAKDKGTIQMTGGSIKSSSIGAIFNDSRSDANRLDGVTISSDKESNSLIFTGIHAQASDVSLNNVRVKNANVGAFAMNQSKITISGGSFTGDSAAIFAESGSTITLTDVDQVTSSNGKGLYSVESNSKITMTGGKVNGKEAALFAKDGGHIDVTNISAIGENNGIKFESSDKSDKNAISKINLTSAALNVKNGIGINVDDSTATVSLHKKSKIDADVLLVTKSSPKEDNFTFRLEADDSTLEGRAETAKDTNVIFDLNNKTEWTLKTSAKERDADGNLLDIAQRSRSDVSVLNINDSSINFADPREDHYHTLHIGSGKADTKAVYNATGDAKIYFNTAWSDGVPVADQKTDRLLIHGDVSGSTTIYIKSDAGDENSVINASDPSNTAGISLIQVSGKAQEDSFKLAHGYITIGGAPYKYTLTGYGPESSFGKASIEQNLFDEKDENFWDFRLHKEFRNPGLHAPAFVPQMANYLIMPNALFYTGLTDMAKQNALLADMRTSSVAQKQEKHSGFFLYTYGGIGTLSSENAPIQYGYNGADLRYAALQGGVNFTALEGQNSATRFGLIGTYGQLSLTPKEMQDADKTTVDKWSIAAYGSIQHDSGFYVDTLLSYGILKGDITNAIRGKTAALKNAKMLNVSTTVGKQFVTGIPGVIFEPQAQLAYQHLMFDKISDSDNITIDMNNPHQWVIRVGGRLTKTVATAENGRSVSFYGKVNAVKTFGDDQTIYIDKDYKLDPMGSLIEGGVGINAQVSPNVSLHGDVSYQQKLQKTGISGASFSGGIRYQF